MEPNRRERIAENPGISQSSPAALPRAALWCCAAAISTGAVHAAEWRVTPRLNVIETYSDNVTLAAPGREVSDWVTQIQPGIRVNGTGARAQLSVDYALLGRMYMSNSDSNGVDHSLNANGLADLWDRRLFLDARANVSQVNVNPVNAQATSNVNITGNRTDLRRWSLTPYFIDRFGSFATIDARYGYAATRTSSITSSTNNDNTRTDLKLDSGPAFQVLGWGLLYGKQKTDYVSPNARDTSLENVSATGRYRMTPTFTALFTVGYEDNNYVSTRGDTSGGFWSAGGDWAPSERTHLTATFGNRYFGNTMNVQFRHRTARTTFGLSASTDLVSTPAQFVVPATANTATTVDNLLRSRIADPIARQQAVQSFITQNGLPVSLDSPVDFFTSQVYTQQRIEATAAVDGLRNTVLVRLFLDRRESENQTNNVSGIDPFATSSNIDQSGIGLVWNWRLTSVTRALMSTGYTRYTYRTISREDDDTYVRVGLVHQFLPKVQGSMELRHLERSSNVAGAGYTENAVTASLFLYH